MTRKDYVLIAKALRKLDNTDAKAELVKTLCIACMSDNKSFDSVKFVVASYQDVYFSNDQLEEIKNNPSMIIEHTA